MEYFEGLAKNETMNYAGYVIKAEDINCEKNNETIVSIFKSKIDYINGNYNERISLNTIGLKQNIIDYMDEVYVDKADIESEKGYFTFVLGYDLLNKMIKKYDSLECDINYEFCLNIAEQFLNSDEYSNFNHSSLEMLEHWLNKNKDRIELEYKKAIGYEDKVYDKNMTIIDKGTRREQPVALIEKSLSEIEKEYIIAFNYRIKDNKIDWAYGYYYDNNISKAKDDFKKVINGENLSKTFEREDNL